MRPALLVLALLIQFPASSATIILVRHAERAGGTEATVPLNERGQQRARTLARVLADAGIQAIYTTDVLRTQQTAAPIAKALNIEPTVLPGRDVDGLSVKLQNLGPGQVVLVVGHSNTLPAIVAKLGGVTPPIDDTEYDRLIIVHTNGSAKPSVLKLHYGE